MLAISRKVGERIVMSGGIEITVVSVGRGNVKLALVAPKDIWIARGEIHDAVALANAAAARTTHQAIVPVEETDIRPSSEDAR